MKHFGATFRILRKERGFTLKTMSEGIISFSYLSKFEKGESDITLENLIRLIERLNMTLDEFLFFSQIRTNHYVELFRKISSAYTKNDQPTLQRYLNNEQGLYCQTGVIYHRCNAIMIASIIQDIDESFSVLQSEIDFLVDYIIKCSFWTTYEVSLLGNTLTFFSEDLLSILLSEVKKRLKEYKVSNRNVRDLISLIENACIIFLRRGKIKEAQSLSNFLDSYLEPFHFFEKTRKLFIDGIIFICKGEIIEGIEKAEQAINIMYTMDKTFASDHEMELRYFLK